MYEGSGFQSSFVDGQYIPFGGIVSRINYDFSGGNTQDVTIDQISVSLVDLFNAGWDVFQDLVWGSDDRILGSANADTRYGYHGDDVIFGGYGDKLVTFDPNNPIPTTLISHLATWWTRPSLPKMETMS